jgi:subfamily B ATP-binding cassette protein MsbA
MLRMPMLSRLLGYVRPYARHLLVALVCLVAYAAFSGAMLYLVKPLFNYLFSGQVPAAPAAAADYSGTFGGMKARLDGLIDGFIRAPDMMGSLERICILIVVVTVAKALFFYLQGYFMAFLQQGIVKRLRDDLYEQFHRLSLSYFHRARTGNLISRVTSDVWVINETLDMALTQMIRDPLLIIFYLYLLLVISVPLTLLATVVVPVSVFLVVKLGKRLRRYSTSTQERMADVSDILEETIGGMRIVKGFAMAPFEIAKFKTATQGFFRAMLKMTRVRLLATPAGEVVGAIMGAVVIWLGGRQVYVEGQLAPADFVTFLVVMFALGRPIKSLSDVHVRMQRGLAAAERVFEVLDTQPQVQDRPGARTLARHERSIEFEGVRFAYDSGPTVLDDVSFAVAQGEVLAVVGPSGAGKSTLLDLIPRFYDPTAGSIRIDGVDLRDVTMASLRARMGIVTQETILFHDTVFRNIAYGWEDATPQQVRRAAEMANAAAFIERMPEGYETIVGARGVRMSGGQRQRIAIARALLRDPEILIFDEATSALDTEAELQVQEAIDRLMQHRTVFVVAHRLSTIKHADRILVLDGGQVAERGTHDELLRRNGLYRHLYDLQFDTQRDDRVGTRTT